MAHDGDGKLEADAIFACFPPMSDDVKASRLDLAFKPRSDPPYIKGDKSPSVD
jgi:hypothetical protein